MNQEKKTVNKEFWEQQYLSGDLGWDVGEITKPLRHYFESLSDTNLRILIPGAGNGWEAGWLHDHGFTNVFVLDIAEAPLANIKHRIPGFPDSHLIHGDFFTHNGAYDLIIEQTFFCAIDPSLRTDYARTMNRLLKPGGLLAGLLFDCEFEGGPPFGGSREEYRNYFAPFFNFKTFDPCYNSISQRAGRELFIRLEKPA